VSAGERHRAAAPGGSRRGTYSIVARDAHSGELGVAVQSHWFSVGSVVSWAQPGVGAAATQSVAEIAHGPHALERLREGLDPEAALEAILAADELADYRQVAVVDARGRAAVRTGAGCIPEAGDERGDGFCCQANMMASPGVPQAMAATYRGHEGDLAERLLAALDAAEAAGLGVAAQSLPGGATLLRRAISANPAWLTLLERLPPELAPTAAALEQELRGAP
jgi:uncharacterized Ntn-hydrolase superfamily protein